MKKRFISKLLMAALVVVTMGVFSSCKDYDDDINANTALINQLQTQVKTLEEAAAKAQADATKALQDADKAQKAADAAQQRANDAYAKGEQGIKDAAEAQRTANQALADAATALAAANQAKADALKALADEAKRLDDAISKKADQTWVEGEIAKLATKDELKKAIKDYDEALQKQLKGLDDKIGDVDTRLTQLDNAFKAAVDTLIGKNQFAAAVAGLGEQIKAVDAHALSLYNANRDTIRTVAGSLKALEEQIKANYYTIEQIDKKLESYATLDYVKGKDFKALIETYIAAITDPMQEQLDSIIGVVTTQGGTIAELDTRMTDVEEAIKTINEKTLPALKKELKKEIDGKADTATVSALGKNVKKNADAIAQLVSILDVVDGKSKVITKIQSDIAAAEEEIAALDSARADHQGRIESLEAYRDQLKTRLKGMSDSIADNAEGVAQNARDIVSLKNEVAGIKTAIATIKNDINTIIKFLDKDLTSIVTLPDEWIYGLPRIDAMLVETNATYKQLDAASAIATAIAGAQPLGPNDEGYVRPVEGADVESVIKHISEDAGNALEVKIMKAGDAVAKAFDINAKYWLNPHTVDATNYTYGFDEIPTKNTISRGATDTDKANPVIKETLYQGDTLYVKFNAQIPGNINNAKMTGGYAYGNAGDAYANNKETFAWITALALTAQRKDTPATDSLDKLDPARRIISDYAILTPSYIDTIAVGNKAKYDGIVKNIEIAHPTMGNQQYHTFNKFYQAWNQDQDGTYSFYLNRTDENAVINLNDSIVFHYRELGSAVEKEWTVDEALAQGFNVKYTILTDKEYFNNGDGKIADADASVDAGLVKVKADKRDVASTAGKTAIVLVELTADVDGKTYTYAYGYVTILITNNTTPVSFEMELNLNCNTGDSIAWTDVIDKISAALGDDTKEVIENTQLYTWHVAAETAERGGYQKYADPAVQTAKENNLHGVIAKNDEGTYLKWTFSTDDVKAAFYKDEKEPNFDKEKPYTVYLWVEATPYGKTQGYDDVIIKITITSVKYPEAGFLMKDRVQGWWYKVNDTKTTDVDTLRYEIHGNVEAVQNNNNITEGALSKIADDEFIFDVSNTFLHKEADGSVKAENKNKFVVVPLNGYEFDESQSLFATLYFDTDKYYLKKASDTKATLDILGNKEETTTFVGASGQKYILFLTDNKANRLKAVKVGDNFDTAQDVVILSGDYNRVATFQGYVYKKDNNKEDFEYAYDLLNHADHLKVGAGETFTSHMVLDYAYCLPISYKNNKFDIKYLRPISAKMADGAERVDATDGGATIKLGELVSFTDWRVEEGGETFDCTTEKGLLYINYYGISAILPNLDKAYTNINTSEKPWDPEKAVEDGWEPLNNYRPQAIRFDFTPGTSGDRWQGVAEGKPCVKDLWATKNDFITGMGTITYENSGLNVRTFRVALPITIVYDWGETKEDWFVVTIVNTQGQPITSRRN